MEIGEGKSFITIAGPCAVESEEQILKTARAVKAAGAEMLRGGAFKPRTGPYSFQGLKEEGLKLLALAGRQTGLPIVSEVMSVENLELVARYVDVLQDRSKKYAKLRSAAGSGPQPQARAAQEGIERNHRRISGGG